MTTNRYILYKHTAPNGKVYIGITCKTPASRWGRGGSGYELQRYFWQAIQKYGWDNFQHEILLDGLSKEDACEKEREYIALYRSNKREYGYNLTTGGEARYELSDEAVEKISSRAKRQWGELTEEEREAISRRAREISARRTREEKMAIIAKAQRTMRERYTPEQKAERYKRAQATRKANSPNSWPSLSEEHKAAIAAASRKRWEGYHRIHPKVVKKKRYYAPRVWVVIPKEERMRLKWQDPEYLAKQEVAAQKRRGAYWHHSEETKAKMRKPKSEETKAKMRKPKSIETRRKMSEAKKKYFANMTPEQRQEFANKCRQHV